MFETDLVWLGLASVLILLALVTIAAPCTPRPGEIGPDTPLGSRRRSLVIHHPIHPGPEPARDSGRIVRPTPLVRKSIGCAKS